MRAGTKTADVVARAVATIAIVATIVWVLWFQKVALGYREFGVNGEQHVEATTSLTAVVVSIFGVGFFCILIRARRRVVGLQVAPLWCRYIARVVDLWVFTFVFANLTTLVPLFVEERRTGSFRWHFERDYGTPSDWLMFLLILAGVAAMAAYFVLPLANGGHTIGCWIMRISTVNLDGRVVALPLGIAFRWAYTEFTELFSPFSLWKIVRRRDVEQPASHDRENRLLVVRY
jgi:uncharacterized RDD family membrane protein YckC